MFGYAAALTSRVKLVTSVLILSQRQTALVAKQAAEVDLLSGGRLELGESTGEADGADGDYLEVPHSVRYRNSSIFPTSSRASVCRR